MTQSAVVEIQINDQIRSSVPSSEVKAERRRFKTRAQLLLVRLPNGRAHFKFSVVN